MTRTIHTLVALALLGPAAAFAQTEPDQVKMSLDEFLKLYETAKDRPDDPEDAPWPAVIASARYTGDVVIEDGEPVAAVFKAKLRVETLKDEGWVRLPVLSSAVALRSARIGGAEAPVSLSGGWYTLVTDRKGAYDLELEFAASVSTRNGSSGLSFPLVQAGGTEVTLSVTGEDGLDFEVPGARLKTDETRGNTRTVHAVLPSTGSLAVSWQREIPEADEQPARVYAEVHTLASVGDGLLSARATVQHTILFNGVDELSVQVPTDMTVIDVQGNGLRDWTREEDGTLKALLNYEAEGSYALTVQLEKVLGDDEKVAVPLITPLGVERSKGFAGVTAAGALELVAGDVSGAAAVDVRTLPGSILGVTGSPVLLGFKYLGAEAEIPLLVKEHEEVDVLVTLLDQGEATTMFTRDGRRLTRVRYQVRNNRRQFLRLSLPDGAELWSSSVAGKAVQPAAGSDGRLLIPLVRSQASGGSLAAFDVDVVYVETGKGPDAAGRGSFKASMPIADAPTTWVGWTVYAPWDAKIRGKSFDGTLRDVEYLSHPVAAAEYFEVQADTGAYQQAASNQIAGGSLGNGAEPVQVSLPLDGQPLYFEKLLALDEELWVSFDYKGLK